MEGLAATKAQEHAPYTTRPLEYDRSRASLRYRKSVAFSPKALHAQLPNHLRLSSSFDTTRLLRSCWFKRRTLDCGQVQMRMSSLGWSAPCGVVDEMCSVDLSDASIVGQSTSCVINCDRLSANCPPRNWQNGNSSGDVASDWAKVHTS